MAVQMLVLLLPFQASAYPSTMNCNFACLGTYTPGSSFGYMGIANIGRLVVGKNSWCSTRKRKSSVPFLCTSPQIFANLRQISRVEAKKRVAQPLHHHRPINHLRVTSEVWEASPQTFAWEAPSTCSGSVKFRALCGAGGSIDEMGVAEEVTEAGCTTVTTTTFLHRLLAV